MRAVPPCMSAAARRVSPVPVVLLACSLPLAAQGFGYDFEPTAREVVVDTDFTTLITKQGPVNVTGGVFVLRSVKIPVGVRVRGKGSNPMIWIVRDSFVVEGELTVRGGNGARVDTLNSANFPTPGGVGNCGGGNGGKGSPSVVASSPAGEPGYGPLQFPAFGGRGGRLACIAGCDRGSGGGGGSFATQGDPWFFLKAGANGSFQQQLGLGGNGCRGTTGSASRTLPGGAPGFRPFRDNDPGNDFFGLAVDVNRRRLVLGELPFPLGGSGGGGGGDRSLTCNNPSWVNDEKGGGGGAGGGVVIVLCAGTIRVGEFGSIDADGGHGGGGEQAGGNNIGAGGGGGAGGMVVLHSTTGIELVTHGETYANGDYDFALSADGGVGTQGRFGGAEITGKYPGKGGVRTRPEWDNNPTGGFGGMGIVQLYAKPGTNQDGTNTILDDSIHVLLPSGQRLTGAAKQRYLAWRGFPDARGVFVDDNGNPTNIGDNEGDIRPSPILLPIF